MAEFSASETVRRLEGVLEKSGYSEEAIAVFRQVFLKRWKPELTHEELETTWVQSLEDAHTYQSKIAVALGKSIENDKKGHVWANDIARQSGVYIVGEQGTGKSSLLENR